MTVTVGIPFRNAQATLLNAIRSVYAQTFTDWELILFNDGSADSSVDIAHAITDSRVRVYSSPSRGLVPCLNDISALARGEFIARMDADDLMHPDRLAIQVNFLLRNPTVDAVGSLAYTVDEQFKIHKLRGNLKFDRSLQSVLRRGLFVHPTVVARRKWARQNPYDKRFDRAEDLELWCRTCAFSRFDQVQVPLLYYRVSSSDLVDRYIFSHRTKRRILAKYAPPAIGIARTSMLWASSLFKTTVCISLRSLGISAVNLDRHSRHLCESEVRSAQEGLVTALSAKVPGCPDNDFSRSQLSLTTATK